MNTNGLLESRDEVRCLRGVGISCLVCHIHWECSNALNICNNIVTAFQGMHVSPANYIYA